VPVLSSSRVRFAPGTSGRAEGGSILEDVMALVDETDRALAEGHVAVVGPLSFLSLIGFILALHDIWWDYASLAVWAPAGQPLPV
jgi:hypothetical protein